MKKTFLISLLLIACSGQKPEAVLSPVEFDKQFKSTPNAVLLDVRTVEEVANGKIANAQNIVYDDVFASKLDSLAHSPLFVYCGSGIRSAKAAKILSEKGYDEVYELAGGIKAWKAAGMPVE
jgi:rhodanese-related sulfurtransferase